LATKYFYLSGRAKWAKLFKPDEKYGNYQLNLYLDKDSEATFDSIGLQLTKKKDDEGTYVTFRRAPKKLIKGELVDFGPPKVIDRDNQPLDKLVGNGSEVTIKVAAFETAKGLGHRLDTVRVENLVEYEAKDPSTGETKAYMPF
jgi:hypothetical protein